MKKKVKIILLTAVLAACAAGGVFYALAPLTVEAAPVRPETATLTFTEQGSYDYEERSLVYPLISGEVLSVNVKAGDAVAAGDVLAVVSASDYEYQIEQLRKSIEGYNGQLANIALAEQQEKDTLNASLETLRGQLVTLEAEMSKNRESDRSLEAQIEIQETIVFHNRNNVFSARQDLDDARDDGNEDLVSAARQAYNAAQNTLSQSQLVLEQLKSGNVPDDVYEGQLQALEGQIASIQTRLAKSYSGGMRQYYQAQIAAAESSIAQLEQKAGQAEITATIAGTVCELPIKDQNLVTQQSHVAAIGSGGRVEVYIPVRELEGVSPGDKVELIVDRRLGKQTIAGTVIEVGTEAVARLSALGVEERKVRVLVRPEEPGLAVGFGMDVRFTVYTQENAVVAPKTAVFEDGGESFVWLIRDGALQRQPVRPSIETRDGYIIDEGLESGDVVVTDANNGALREGKRAAASAA